MSTARIAVVSWVVSLTRGWTALYTALASDEGSARRAEIESDLFEYRHDLANADTGQSAVARHLLARWLRGAPADIRWRLGRTRATTRGAVGVAGGVLLGIAVWWVPLMRADVLPTPPAMEAFVPAPLEAEHRRWVDFSFDRLRQFGFGFQTF